jgi:phenylacetate-CoA ligase
MSTTVDADTRRRNPCITAAGARMLDRIRQHRDAPRWNHVAGDRLRRTDLRALDVFREALRTRRAAFRREVPEPIRAWVADRRRVVPSFRGRIPEGADLERTWAAIPTMSREDVAVRPELLVPDDADLDGLIVYRTAGTTGHSLLVPHAPRAAGCYLPLLELALARHGVEPEFSADVVACFLVGAQAHTVTYPTVLSGWRQAGFAKLNLSPSEWRDPESPQRFFDDLDPLLLTGDPISFAEMLRRGVPARPLAMVSTAVAMSHALRDRLAAHFGCPVIDWYSLTETGPIGYACPRTDAYHVLPHDVFVEVLDEEGGPAAEGVRGEVVVTGGRNPYLPLLRYRTGDWGRLDFAPCACGDPAPRIVDLEGRRPVLFRAADGALVNPVDLSRVLRRFPFVQHEFSQDAGRTCELVVRPVAGVSLDEDAVAAALRDLLGDVPLSVRVDSRLGDRTGLKLLPYRSEIHLED